MSITPPDDREESIIHQVQELPPAERASFIESACGGDSELCERVKAILKAQAEAGGSGEGTVVDVTALRQLVGEKLQAEVEAGEASGRPVVDAQSPHARPELAAEERAGNVIGRYRLLEKIGEGGFGAVYVADQLEPVKRRVAIKIIKLGMDTRQVVARFEAERQALAMMDHPNIAKVLDGGSTDAGRPYFVMELVRGIAITQYCDENNLPTEKRLHLFTQTCQAIQHAHQKGIIHRDIKPSNILVTLHDGKPVPKVIDFGIARATQGELTDKTVYTQFQQFIGTPAYVSPEQAEMSGLDIDTRSDIYSLGVLLYELLIGKTPFDAKELMKAGLDAMRQAIRNQEPLRPSTRLSSMSQQEQTATAKRRGAQAPKLISLLRGDLDWIVMKCLEKDRTCRYDSASLLAADVQCYLQYRPVIAAPPSYSRTLRKFLRRRSKEVLVASALMSCVALGAFIFVQERQSASSRRVAQVEHFRREEAEALSKIISGKPLNDGEELRARDLASRLTTRITRNAGSQGDCDLLARFLARGARIQGRLIQSVDKPAVSFWIDSGEYNYGLGGVGVVIEPQLTADGKIMELSSSRFYISGRAKNGGLSTTLPSAQINSKTGTKRFSGVITAQLAREDDTSHDMMIAEPQDLKFIGQPVNIALSPVDCIFLKEVPQNYPIEVPDEQTARQLTNALTLSDGVIRVQKGQFICEFSVTLPVIKTLTPIALQIDLVRFADRIVQARMIGIVAEDGAFSSNTDVSQMTNVYYSIGGKGTNVVVDLSFAPPSVDLSALPPGYLTATFRIRSSREVAMATERLQYFLAIPEVTKIARFEKMNGEPP